MPKRRSAGGGGGPVPAYLREVTLPQKTSAIQTIRFNTGLSRLKQCNREFVLRFYLPGPDTPKPYEGVFVLLNGLGEADVRVYDDLGEELSRYGIPSVLLPLPNHFCRWSRDLTTTTEEDNVEVRDPYRFKKGIKFGEVTTNLKQRLLTPENVLVDGFHQLIEDIKLLIGYLTLQQLSQQNKEFFETHFSGDTRVSLYGYSLGGLLALSTLLLMPSKINCCVLVNSGASIQDIRFPSLIFKNAREWEKAQMNAYSGFGPHSLPADLHRIYYRIFLGNDRLRLRRMLKSHFQQLLFVMGARDEVFSLHEVLQIGPEQTGLAVLQVPVLGHWIGVKGRDQGDQLTWDLWKSFIVESMASFEKNNPGRNRNNHFLDILKLDNLGNEEEEQWAVWLLVADEDRFKLAGVSSNLSIIRGLRESIPLTGHEGRAYQAARSGPSAVGTECEVCDLGQPEALGYEEQECRLFSEQGFKSVAVVPLRVSATPFCLGVIAIFSDLEIEASCLHLAKIRSQLVEAAKILSALLLKDRGLQS